VEEVSDNLSNVGQVEPDSYSNNASKTRLDTLGSEVDVWV
jgi:hypothetical protein